MSEDPATNMAEQDDSHFHESSNPHPLEQDDDYYFATEMEHSDGVLLVTDVLLYPLDKLEFTEFARKILAVNEGVEIRLLRMRRLWAAVINIIFDYECACKLKEKIVAVSGCSLP